MNRVFLRSKQKRSKAFIFTIDAIISLGIAIGLSNSLVLLNNTHVDLNEVLLYQQAQDVVEVCSKLNTPNNECFGPLLEKLNPALHYCVDCNAEKGVVVRREYLLRDVELRVWI